MQMVSQAFMGKNSGSIDASNDVFGDPCGGTYKRLAVILMYIDTTNMIKGVVTVTCAKPGSEQLTAQVRVMLMSTDQVPMMAQSYCNYRGYATPVSYSMDGVSSSLLPLSPPSPSPSPSETPTSTVDGSTVSDTPSPSPSASPSPDTTTLQPQESVTVQTPISPVAPSIPDSSTVVSQPPAVLPPDSSQTSDSSTSSAVPTEPLVPGTPQPQDSNQDLNPQPSSDTSGSVPDLGYPSSSDTQTASVLPSPATPIEPSPAPTSSLDVAPQPQNPQPDAPNPAPEPAPTQPSSSALPSATDHTDNPLQPSDSPSPADPAPAPDANPTPAPAPAPEPAPAPAPNPQPDPQPSPASPADPQPVSSNPAPAPEPTPAPAPATPNLEPDNPSQLPKDIPLAPPAEALVAHVQEDKPGVENGGIQFFGTQSQPQVVGEDGKLTPPAPPPGSGLPIPPDAITTADTFIGQPGGTSFNAPDIAVPVIETPVTGALAAVPGVQALNHAFVAMANIGNDMSPVTRKKAKKILVATIVASGLSQLRRKP